SFIQKRLLGLWNYGFNLAWELDFWGRFRRTIDYNADSLDASVENYDAALVTLLGDVATNYAQYRTYEQRIAYARDNVSVQRQTLKIVQARFNAGTTTALDLDVDGGVVAQVEGVVAAVRRVKVDNFRMSGVFLRMVMPWF